MPIWLALAAAGAAKHLLIDKPQANKQTQLAAETQRYSPWTGLTAQAPSQPNIFGSAIQGGLAGASLQGGMDAAANGAKLNDALTNHLNGIGGFTPTANALQQGIQTPVMPKWGSLLRG